MATKRPRLRTLLWRAVRLRCAWCGSRHGILRGWFGRHDACQHCGLSVERGQVGFQLGAATVNVIVTFGALIAAGAVWIVGTYPDVSTIQLLVVLGIVGLLLPIVLHPFTNTVWFAVELMMEPPEPCDLAAARERVVQRERA